jgi:hypothetical protein
VIEVYAIVDADRLEPADGLGLAIAGDLAAVWGPAGDGEATPEALWRHEEIVETLIEAGDLLPVRYGTRFAEAGAAADAVAARHDELRAALDRLRGATEVSLRVRGAGSDLQARAQARNRVHQPLSQLARASTCRPEAPGELLRAAYLVDRDAVPVITRRVAELQGEHSDLSLLCTGPWPPYSFASA